MTTLPVPATPETVFTYAAPTLKFGSGAVDELAHDLSRYAVRRVLVVTDAGVAATGSPGRVAEALQGAGLETHVYDEVHVEPTDESVMAAVTAAREAGPFDAIVAVGGGSAIDTAKGVNLLITNDGDLWDYLNVPVGKGKAPAKPLLPLVAVPTTTGTGAESTTNCIMDVLSLHVKTGISHQMLRPVLAVVDPELTRTQPAGVTACAGLDILCHALESWTARPYTSYEKKQPAHRVPYCGSNPISDQWCQASLTMLARSFRTAVHQPDDETARFEMALAATMAGMGFGNAGVHIPHANGYPIAGRVRDFHPADYPQDEAMVPHGMSVAITAPAAFRFTYDADPARHIAAARMLEPGITADDDRELLPLAVTNILRDVGMPNGVAALGFTDGDIDDLVGGTLKQQRLLATAPRPVDEAAVAAIFRESMQLW